MHSRGSDFRKLERRERNVKWSWTIGGLSCLTDAGTRRSMICLSWLCLFFESGSVLASGGQINLRFEDKPKRKWMKAPDGIS
ncbi:MAG: hypothetical protein ACTS4X_00705 [Candidatus Hodgkinia cicadicola]